MNEMVKRVAGAMEKRAKEPVGNLHSLEPMRVGSLGIGWEYLAKAAIAEMREPTEAMKDAAFCENNFEQEWEAAIDAALGSSMEQ